MVAAGSSGVEAEKYNNNNNKRVRRRSVVPAHHSGRTGAHIIGFVAADGGVFHFAQLLAAVDVVNS